MNHPLYALREADRGIEVEKVAVTWMGIPLR
jgi:hypothetical protein